MNTGILKRAFGISNQICIDSHCESNKIVLKIQTPKENLRCPHCGSQDVVCDGKVLRRFVSVPIGLSKTVLEMPVQRLKCKCCGKVQQEDIDFAKGKSRHTIAFANMVIDLSRFATIQDIAWFLQVSWDVVRNIQMEFLQKEYANPSLKGLKYIGIDEFAIRKGHAYKTIVIDLETGRIVYVGDGNSKDSLKEFRKRLGDNKESIEAVTTDMSLAYTGEVIEHLPNASLVIDHFHVVKLMNEKIDKLRRLTMRTEKDVNKRRVIKGTRWLLLRNGSDIFDQKFRTRLDNALNLNQPLMTAYYLKEDLREIWNQLDKKNAETVLDEWVVQARDSKFQPLMEIANTLAAFKPYILAWYDHTISNGKTEGVNNKIKVLKRQAYGFRCNEFLTLKLYSLHDKRLRI